MMDIRLLSGGYESMLSGGYESNIHHSLNSNPYLIVIKCLRVDFVSSYPSPDAHAISLHRAATRTMSQFDARR